MNIWWYCERYSKNIVFNKNQLQIFVVIKTTNSYKNNFYIQNCSFNFIRNMHLEFCLLLVITKIYTALLKNQILCIEFFLLQKIIYFIFIHVILYLYSLLFIVEWRCNFIKQIENNKIKDVLCFLLSKNLFLKFKILIIKLLNFIKNYKISLVLVKYIYFRWMFLPHMLLILFCITCKRLSSKIKPLFLCTFFFLVIYSFI